MEGPKVQLFVTCLVDSLAPAVGRATVDVLDIEQQLNLGVHGPRHLHVIMIK